TVHRALAARLGSGEPRAVLLDAPYAFQENVADVTAKAQSYFARSVGLRVEAVRDSDLAGPADAASGTADAASGTADAASGTAEAASGTAAIRTADWVFAGPGSPSYALARWRGGQAAQALRDRIAAGHGVTVFASAAAAACGSFALPVYEIYKVGADPHWLDGLDLMSVLGLKVVVIPHYDNAEGGTHDTRFCYLGERRLAMLERELPADSAVLGVDEHTALVIDLATQQAQVLGRGGVTIRKAGVSTVLPAGSAISLADLRTLAVSGQSNQNAAPASDTAGSTLAVDQPESSAVLGELPELTAAAEGQFDAAARDKNSDAMVSAILDLEAAIESWASDTDENDNSDRARAVLRGLVVRLGKTAEGGLADPADRLRPAVDPLIALRGSLRKGGDYAAADTIRDALAAAGVELRDSPDGTSWALAGPT
ncbi:MAG TPA: hypothetical protein VF979_04125, partial [Streptosporangiaceae bacterium]